MTVERISIQRLQLYELVWAEPLRAIAKQLGVSEVVIADLCRKLRVPRPSLGAWQRVRAGHKLHPRPLPSPRPGEPETLEAERFVPEPPDPRLEAALLRERSSGEPIHVADLLQEPHPLVARTQRALHRAKPRHGLLYPESKACLDIVVSKAQIERALRIMDALVKALLSRGLVLEVIPHDPPTPYELNMKRVEPHRAFHTQVKIDGIAVPIALREGFRWVSKVDGRPFTGSGWMSGFAAGTITRAGTGVLEFNTSAGRHGYWRSHWREGKRKSLEGLLRSFIVGLIEIAHEVRVEREDDQRRRMEEAERQRIKEEERKREAEEAERVKFLRGQLRDRRLAQDIRLYVAEVQTVLDDAGLGHIERTGLAEHLRWATEYSDRLDPTTRARRSIREGLAELRAREGPAAAPGALQT